MTAARLAPRRSKPLAPERLQLVLELGRRITAHRDLQTLLPEACRLIADAFGYDLVGINLLDPLSQQRLYQAAAKLGVTSRTEAVLEGIKRGLLRPELT